MDAMVTPAGMPELDFDPFSRSFLEDPFPDHTRLRDVGPVARLTQYDVYAVGRHAEVRAVLQDWEAFSSAAGVGLADFRREKPWRLPSLVLETDPPVHGRARRVLSRVLSAGAITALRERFQRDADEMVAELAARGSFDAVPDLAEAYPLRVFPDAVGMPRENRPLFAAVWQHGVQLFWSAQRIFRGRRPGRRPGVGMGAGAVATKEPGRHWVRRRDPRRR